MSPLRVKVEGGREAHRKVPGEVWRGLARTHDGGSDQQPIAALGLAAADGKWMGCDPGKHHTLFSAAVNATSFLDS